jgi:magnesium chelatase subunit D
VRASEGFRLAAAMNPFDAIGTARVSHAIADRICRVVLGYQDAAAEREITTGVTGRRGPVADFAVTLTRATREHPDVRMGSSVRGRSTWFSCWTA